MEPLASTRHVAGFEASAAEVRRRLRDFIARRVGDLDTAEDLTQEVFLKVHRAGMSVDDVEDVAAWLYRIARHTLVDHYRALARRPRPEELPPDRSLVDDLGGEDRAVRELARCLRPLIADLEPIYRDALTLTDLGGLSQTEAAGQAGISVSGMKSRVQRARVQLKNAVSECCTVYTDAAGRINDYYAAPDCHCVDPALKPPPVRST